PNRIVYVAGKAGTESTTRKMAQDGISEHTAQTLKNISAILESAGTSMQNVVKTTVYLHAISDFPQMNKIYAEFFPNMPPARTTVGDLDLPVGAQVEIDAIAVMP